MIEKLIKNNEVGLCSWGVLLIIKMDNDAKFL
jgi:hypothetical protein